MAKKRYSDGERMEIVKKLRASGLSIKRHARENGIAHALENVDRKPLEVILPCSKDLEIR